MSREEAPPDVESPADRLEAFANPSPERGYRVRCETPELTCVCPFTGQPDFATVVVDYLPAGFVVELKSLKMYLWGYRDTGISHEAITNRILDDLAALLSPQEMTVETRWLVRGGITTTVTARHPSPDAGG
ncbi:MAG TPA: NADPH-dependent 7-cyano-7-deazaguanine reductase QueF [Acidimicrobiaceae bacterium]|nr:NADPH-dependent 7-cyano-7-deazaguanine reductase QueF [Acidimicrobiaceae bacterium]HCB37983.1 NADPH-dependent 7-cyano-7-deazaguanine reductase QueF [Acidimicrobiaceae bacterium]